MPTLWNDPVPLTTSRIQHSLDASYFFHDNSIYYRILSKKAEQAFSRFSRSADFPGCVGFCGISPPYTVEDNSLLVAPEDGATTAASDPTRDLIGA